jgi:hypothetical protein
VRVPCGDELGERPVPAGRPPAYACLATFGRCAQENARPCRARWTAHWGGNDLVRCDARVHARDKLGSLSKQSVSKLLFNISIRRIAPINIAQSIHQWECGVGCFFFSFHTHASSSNISFSIKLTGEVSNSCYFFLRVRAIAKIVPVWYSRTIWLKEPGEKQIHSNVENSK